MTDEKKKKNDEKKKSGEEPEVKPMGGDENPNPKPPPIK